MNGNNHQTYSGISVLVVEDNDVNQKVTKAILKHFGIIPDVAANGVDAINDAINKKYDLIFMDCLMPVMDGFEATKKIRSFDTDRKNSATSSTVPILALTANTSDEDIQLCKEAGMSDIIAKPAKLEDIGKKLNIWCNKENNDNHVTVQHELPIQQFLHDNLVLDANKIAELYDIMGKGLAEALNSFVTSAKQKLAELSTAIQAGDSGRIRDIAHNLKGMSANIGAQQMAETSKAVMMLTDYGDFSDLLPYFHTLEQQFNKVEILVLSIIEKYC